MIATTYIFFYILFGIKTSIYINLYKKKVKLKFFFVKIIIIIIVSNDYRNYICHKSDII